MIYVLLTAELPWQRNDAIMFVTCLCISWNQDFFFLEIAEGSSCLPSLPRLWQSFNNFYESVLEIFWNEVLRVTNE